MRLPLIDDLAADPVPESAWYTPPHIFEGLGPKLRFDLDVAGPPGGVPWVPADRTLSVDDNGLATPWEGFVWMNPPYSDPGPWMEKFIHEGDAVAMLVADTSTEWWHTWAARANAICFLRGRLTFVMPDGASAAKGHFRYPVALLGVGVQGATRLLTCKLGWVVIP